MKTPLLSPADVAREAAAFPTLNAEEVAAARAAGAPEFFAAGQSLFEAGQMPMDCFVIVTGEAEVFDTSGDEERLIVRHRAGAIIGDISVLAGQPAIAACRASERSEIIRLTVVQMRALLIRSANLGEK